MQEISKEDRARFAAIFKALSNENRLHIYLRLLGCCAPEKREDNCNCMTPDKASEYVGTIGEVVDVVPSTVSHHLKELRNAGLIKSERKGQNVCCWPDMEILEELREFFARWQ